MQKYLEELLIGGAIAIGLMSAWGLLVAAIG
jgi:hypothetical protein